MQEDRKSVLVVGAGPTGLNLAIWLTRLGVGVRIIDRLAHSGNTSRALAVQARTLEFYRQIGIADAVVSGGVKIIAFNIWVRGKKAARALLGETGKGISPFPFALVYPQDAHEKMLEAKLASLGVRVEREKELVALEQDERGVTATVRSRGGESETIEAGYLAGCDGASSTVRHRIGVGFPGGTYEGLFYVADVNTPSPVSNGELHADLEDADFLLVFPLSGAGNLRLVGYAGEAVRAGGDKLSFEDVRGRAIDRLKLENLTVNWFSTYQVHHRVAARFRKGRVFLLGDAAHVHSPVGGQGMNTGIGDAVNLAWKMAAVLHGRADSSLLETFEAERIAFAERLVATTDRGFTVVTARGAIARIIRTRVVPVIVPLAIRLAFFRRLMFRTVSQVNVSYRHSALSEGKVGRIAGGERLPWVRFGSEDNFEFFSSLDWQVHVYGSVSRALREACQELRVPMHDFPFTRDAKKAGLVEGAVYLLRPDGYIAVACSPNRVELIGRYLKEWGLQL